MAKKTNDTNKQSGGITDKKDPNAGSGAFNQGSEQDPAYNDGIDISAEEKKTGKPPSPLNKEKTGDENEDNK